MLPWSNQLTDFSSRFTAARDPIFIQSGPTYHPPPRRYNASWIWIDLETSSLEPRDPRFRILEICLVATDHNLVPVDKLTMVLKLEKSDLFYCSRWVKTHFRSRHLGGNGLIDKCLLSSITPVQAGVAIRSFLTRHATIRPNGQLHRILLAGSSVWFDRLSLLTVWPNMCQLVSHKTIDCSSLLEMARRFRPDALRRLPTTSGSHEAEVDILESLSLMRWFKKCFMSSPEMF